YLAGNQSGVVSRAQALRAGLTVDMIKFRVRSGRWRQIHPGVYATFTGMPGRSVRLWAAVLSAGPGAVLSYQTAAELQGLADKPDDSIRDSSSRASCAGCRRNQLASVRSGGGGHARRLESSADQGGRDRARPHSVREDFR